MPAHRWESHGLSIPTGSSTVRLIRRATNISESAQVPGTNPIMVCLAVSYMEQMIMYCLILR